MSERRARFRISLVGLSIAYFVVLGLILVGIEWFAEYFLPLWLLLFAPTAILLLPILLLAVFAIRYRHPRLLVAYAGCVLLVAFGFNRYRFSGSATATPKTFTVISHNIGQGNRWAFEESFAGAKPDAVLLQDAGGRQAIYSRRYPDLQLKGVAQFLVLSRHEIEEVSLVQNALWRGRPVAARFVIRVGDRPIVLYNVHLPTPRRSLTRALSKSVAMEMLWLSDAPMDDYPSYRSWLSARVQLARQLADVFAREPLPYLVGGDFNTPDHGVVYRSFASRFIDAHAHAGRGWGFTFPGAGDGTLARVLGPWLRLDYLFAGPGWKAIDCRVAMDTQSQHRAVLARFEPSH